MSKLFYSAARIFFRIVFTLYNRLGVRGLGNIPRGVTVIVASNHSSFIDPPLIGAVFPGRLRYLAKESLFRVPVLKFLIRALGAVPVTREDSQRAGAVMKLLLGRLREKESILLFPEGSRSPDGRLKPLEAGVAWLSVKTGVPVLPVYIGGSHKAWPKGHALPRPSKLTFTASPPIFPDAGIKDERERRGKLMGELESALSAMEKEALNVR
jgi:1-acyl-sn-glycerol-3-phosphate acyltransferase